MAEATGSGLPDVNWSAVPPEIARWANQMRIAQTIYGVSVPLLAAVMTLESDGDPNSYSSAGAIGLMQVMPFNAEGCDLWEPQCSINTGADILAGNIRASGGDLNDALQSYNGGSYRGSDTAWYAATVLGYYRDYSSGSSVDATPPYTRVGNTDPQTPYEAVIPNCVLAWDGMRANVENILPQFYSAIIWQESALTPQSGGGGGHYS